MIVDITGTVLIPGNNGKGCPGNGKRRDYLGRPIICCEECDYALCCFEAHGEEDCKDCLDKNCPHAGRLSRTLKNISLYGEAVL